MAVLSAARRERQLGAEDLERLAVAAYLLGKDESCDEAWIAAHHLWVRGGEAERAARCAFWQALGLFFRVEVLLEAEDAVAARAAADELPGSRDSATPRI